MKNYNLQKDWIYFKSIFLDKYFPDSLRAKKELEFQQLRHETMLVETFAKKFEDMATYSSQALYIPDEKSKIN